MIPRSSCGVCDGRQCQNDDHAELISQYETAGTMLDTFIQSYDGDRVHWLTEQRSALDDAFRKIQARSRAAPAPVVSMPVVQRSRSGMTVDEVDAAGHRVDSLRAAWRRRGLLS